MFFPIGFELRASCLVDRHFTILIHIPGLSEFGYFWDRGSRFCQELLGLLSSYFCFHPTWDERYMRLSLAFLCCWDGVLFTFFFLTGLGLICNHPSLCLLSSWDYRYEPLWPPWHQFLSGTFSFVLTLLKDHMNYFCKISKYVTFVNKVMGIECSSVVKCLLSMFKVLHSIPSTAKIKDFGGLVHVVEHLLCKYKALISKLQSHQKKKKSLD
jgi:hypothetical protein